MRRVRSAFLLGSVLSVLLVSGCASVMEEVGRMATLSRCQFRIASLGNTRLAGVPLQGGEPGDLNLPDLARIQSAFSSGTLPLRFTLNLEVKNPNSSPAGLSRMEWVAFVDDQRLTSGSLEKSVTIPPRGGVGTLPLEVALDLKQTMSGKTLDSLIRLALNVAGQGSEPSKMKLEIKPSITVEGRAIDYPGVITVTREYGAN